MFEMFHRFTAQTLRRQQPVSTRRCVRPRAGLRAAGRFSSSALSCQNENAIYCASRAATKSTAPIGSPEHEGCITLSHGCSPLFVTVSRTRRGNAVRRPWSMLPAVFSAVREQAAVIAGQSERTIMLGTILIASAVSGAACFVLTQYYSIDVISSLAWLPVDCFPNWEMKVGRHCFNDYGMFALVGVLPNPWEPYKTAYPAGGLVPLMIFASPAAWLHIPRLGLYGYLFALTTAIFTPAVWAARGACGLERVVVFMALGALAIPAWMTIDRGNSVGFVVPIALVFLVALCKRRWGLVATMVILAALVKPQFAVLAVALFAGRQWRMGGITVGGVVLSNIAAYLLWPRDFPETIAQSIHNARDYGTSFPMLVGINNVSFANGVLLIPDHIMRMKLGYVPPSFLAGPRLLIGIVVLLVVVGWVLALGRRIPSVMVGIVLLATASLFPAMTGRYYLAFALPVAALVARYPYGPRGFGIFDWFAVSGDRRRAVGICASIAAALTIAQIALPGGPGEVDNGIPVVGTTAILAPILWLVACAAILISYTRKPACRVSANDSPKPIEREHIPETTF